MRNWRGTEIKVEIDDNNLVLMEFASDTLAVAAGSNCRGSSRIPWGGLGLYGTDGTLEITDVDQASGYPLRFEVQADGGDRAYGHALTDHPYLRGEHLKIEEPHLYVDIMELADAIRENRSPRATGEQARHVVEIIEKAQAAARTGQAQPLATTF